jgi:uncharacterized protein YlxP (DUF503 family)
VFAAVLAVEMHLPACRSLKEKRSVLRPITDALPHRFPVTVAEVDYQDLWQRAGLGIVTVSGSAHKVDSILDAVERYMWSRPDIEITSTARHWIDTEKMS